MRTRRERRRRSSQWLRRLVATTAFLVASGPPWAAQAHEAGAPFSGAILDPLVLHHAHIENEQRLNTFATQLAPDATGTRPWGFESELELSWAEPTYHFGVEAFVPVVNLPSANGGRVTGIGDVEIRPLKLSLFMTREIVLATATGVQLPTGAHANGIGSGHTTFSQLLFLDCARANWFFGANVGAMMNEHGLRGLGFEYGAVGSYSFISGTGSGVAAAVPSQSVVVATSLEVLAESFVAGADPAMTTLRLLPGLSLWWPATGWQLRVGIETPPLHGDTDGRWRLMLQVGNHRRWTRLLDPAAPPTHEHGGHAPLSGG